MAEQNLTIKLDVIDAASSKLRQFKSSVSEMKTEMGRPIKTAAAPLAKRPAGGPVVMPDNIDIIRGRMSDFFDDFKTRMTDGVDKMFGAVGKPTTGDKAPSGAVAGAAAGAVAGLMVASLTKLVDFNKKIFQIITESAPQLEGTLKWIYNILSLSLYPIGQAIANILIPMAESLTNLTTEMLVKFGDLNIKDTDELVAYFVELFKLYINFAVDVLKGVALPLMEALLKAGAILAAAVFVSAGTWLWDEIVKAVGVLADWVGGAFSTVGEWLWNEITTAIGNLGDWLGGLGEWLWKKITNAIDVTYHPPDEMEDTIRAQFWGFGYEPTGFPTLMAAGGIVSSPTLAMIGESGPEAVIPLDKMGNMGGMEIVININAPIYGVQDLEASIRNIISREQMGYASYR